jgi:tetratricopeptide (TPR) repeat protein
MRLWIVLFSLSWASIQAELVCSKGCASEQTGLVSQAKESINTLFSQLFYSIKNLENAPRTYYCSYPQVTRNTYTDYSYSIKFILYDNTNPWLPQQVFDKLYCLGTEKHHYAYPAEYFLKSGLLLTYDSKDRCWPVTYHGQYICNEVLYYLNFYHPTSVHLFLETLTTDVQELFDLSQDASEKSINADKVYIKEIEIEDPQSHFIKVLQKDLKEANRGLLAIKDEGSYCQNLVKQTSAELRQQYQSTLDYCIAHHQSCWAYYHRGFQKFIEGNIEDFLEDIDNLLQVNQKTKEAESLLPHLYIDKGFAEGELGLYQQAISSLNHAIEKDPRNRQAYFERAALYFETGQFELSLADYLKCEWDPSYLDRAKYGDFAQGLLIGARNGLQQSAAEFFPSILGSLRGLGNLIWATVQHPIDSPIAFAKATQEFFGYLRSCDRAELAELLVPEMYQLVTNWDTLDQRQRGELSGFCLGKYGTDILLPIAAVKGFKYVYAYRSIRAADKLCTLEALASTPESRQALIESATYWNAQRTSKLANVKIIPDLQNQHIPGKHNFNPTKSILSHPDPQQLLNRHAGTGQKVRGTPGKAGYKERIDCGEIIGYYLEEGNPTQHPTTMGIIHYNKKGAHIVPAKPKKQ